MICPFLKSFFRGTLAVCGQMVWLVVGWLERPGFTQRMCQTGLCQTIEGFRMRGIPTPCEAFLDLRNTTWRRSASG